MTKRRYGNRYTGSHMTQREADTITGCYHKLMKVRDAMDKRGVWLRVRLDLDNTLAAMVDALKNGGRLDDEGDRV